MFVQLLHSVKMQLQDELLLVKLCIWITTVKLYICATQRTTNNLYPLEMNCVSETFVLTPCDIVVDMYFLCSSVFSE